mmetsp:Transcript_9148/g.27479  ORF Transcript_9148/g.27479 Transcript_9148/m.27479 type:complete len:245 (-) Transcript_9148:1081-1815(-)
MYSPRLTHPSPPTISARKARSSSRVCPPFSLSESKDATATPVLSARHTGIASASRSSATDAGRCRPDMWNRTSSLLLSPPPSSPLPLPPPPSASSMPHPCPRRASITSRTCMCPFAGAMSLNSASRKVHSHRRRGDSRRPWKRYRRDLLFLRASSSSGAAPAPPPSAPPFSPSSSSVGDAHSKPSRHVSPVYTASTRTRPSSSLIRTPLRASAPISFPGRPAYSGFKPGGDRVRRMYPNAGWEP